MGRQQITHACTTCHQPFFLNPVQAARLRKNPNAPAYCGRACAGVDSAPLLTCAHCAAEFAGLPEQRRHARKGMPVYCSREHFFASRVTFKCGKCNAVFATTDADRRRFRSGKDVLCAGCRT